MLLVKTKIGPSSIAGIGLFADEFISKGAPVMTFQEGFDIRLTKEEFNKLSQPAQAQVLNYCWVNEQEGTYLLCADDGRFFNHADDPNVSSGLNDDHIDRALRDIEPGEELTQNYKAFDGHAIDKLS